MDLIKKLQALNLVQEETKIQTEFLIKRFELPKSFRPSVTVDFKSGWPSSGGVDENGKPTMQLCFKSFKKWIGDEKTFMLFPEYAFIENHAKIGSLWATWRPLFSTLIAHELAHCLDQHNRYREYAAKFFPKKYELDRRGHGLLWQAIYKSLRTNTLIRYKGDFYSATARNSKKTYEKSVMLDRARREYNALNTLHEQAI